MDIQTKYGYLLYQVKEMQRIIEERRGNTPLDRHRKLKKILYDTDLCKLVEEDYPFNISSTQSIKDSLNRSTLTVTEITTHRFDPETEEKIMEWFNESG